MPRRLTIPQIIARLKPGAEWVMDGEDLSTLRWIDGAGHTKPTLGEIEGERARIEAEVEAEELEDARVSTVSQRAGLGNRLRQFLTAVASDPAVPQPYRDEASGLARDFAALARREG